MLEKSYRVWYIISKIGWPWISWVISVKFWVYLGNWHLLTQIKTVKRPTSQEWVYPGKRQNEPLNSQSDFVWFVNLSNSISSKSDIRRKIISEIFRLWISEKFQKRILKSVRQNQRFDFFEKFLINWEVLRHKLSSTL